MARPLTPIPPGFPVTLVPAGVRTIKLAAPSDSPKVVADTCDKGDRVPRLPHLDQLDGDE